MMVKVTIAVLTNNNTNANQNPNEKYCNDKIKGPKRILERFGFIVGCSYKLDFIALCSLSR